MSNNFFFKLMVTRVNPLQMAAKTYETKRKCMVTPAKKR